MPFCKFVTRALSICLAGQVVLAVQMNTAAHAEMATTQMAIEKYAAHADRLFLLSEVRREEIRDEIVALGIDPAEAEARLAALSDAEVATMVANIKSEPAGAGVVEAALTVFVILIVTDLLCLTNLFRFTRCQLN